MHKDPYTMSAMLGVQLAGFTKKYGLDFSATCLKLGIDQHIFASLTGRIPGQQFAELLEELSFQSGDPFFGFNYALSFDFGAGGKAVMHARDLRSAWDFSRKYRFLGFNNAKLNLIIDGGTAKIVSELSPFIRDMPQILDFEMVTSSVVYSSFGNIQTEVLQINTRRISPTNQSLHNDLFKGKVAFNQSEASVVFPSNLLDRPNPKADLVLFNYMRLQCEALLKLSLIIRPIEDDVRQAVLEGIAGDEPNLPSIAKQLAMSERSLQRQLNRRGLSFSQLLDQTRRDYAAHLLCYDKGTIEEIALKVGFQSPSGFSRAASIWFGMSPSRYRKELRKN